MIIGNPITLGGSGSGGGLDPSKPLIHVNAPLGSTIDITLSSLIIATIPPSQAFPNVDGETAEYYYSCPSTGTYTVTATLGSDTSSETVVASADVQYNIELSFNLVLYENGVYTSKYTAQDLVTNGTATDEATYILLATRTNYTPYVYKRWNLVDVTPYSTLTAYLQGCSGSTGAMIWAKTFLTQNASLAIASQAEYKQALSAFPPTVTAWVDFSFSIDVSAITGYWYIGTGIDNDGAAGSVQRQGRIHSIKLLM